MKLGYPMLVLGVVCVGLGPFAHAAEKKITEAELPAAVKTAMKDVSQGATIKGYSKEVEDGQLEYEVEMTVDGHSKDASFAPDGRLLEVEEQVELSALPPAVQDALKAKAKGGNIAKVESLTKGGKLVAYEAKVRTNGKHSEVQVGPNGETLSHEE